MIGGIYAQRIRLLPVEVNTMRAKKWMVVGRTHDRF